MERFLPFVALVWVWRILIRRTLYSKTEMVSKFVITTRLVCKKIPLTAKQHTCRFLVLAKNFQNMMTYCAFQTIVTVLTILFPSLDKDTVLSCTIPARTVNIRNTILNCLLWISKLRILWSYNKKNEFSCLPQTILRIRLEGVH